jgi:hypothetical protein
MHAVLSLIRKQPTLFRIDARDDKDRGISRRGM